MAKTVVGEGEFAIKLGALFNLTERNVKVNFKPDGTLSVTLTFATDVSNVHGPGEDISSFNTGVFNASNSNHLLTAGVKPLSLYQDSSNRISLNSNQNDITLSTNAEKGRQGNS